MNPPCARCKKTVYPVEKLSCLDKIWHKACFTCETCNLKLTMKTYKGYNKLPYCNTHYPTTKFTAVADTPENRRLANQTTNQSQIAYQKDYQKSVGSYTQVADSVETRQARQSASLASQAQYRQPPPEMTHDPHPPTIPSHSYHQPEPVPSYQPPPHHPPPPHAHPPPTGPRYQAVYDYQAADDDEVSFSEGDIIINVEVIDEGWMTGTVQRTGETGMLPSNYVERV